jgi:thiosulfate/3-mercaptopyruvate sulfurtransferase
MAVAIVTGQEHPERRRPRGNITRMQPIVDLGWLVANLDGLVLADVRWYADGRSPRGAYEAGHLPGAVFVDLERWLSAEATPEAGRHPLPEPERFAKGMSELGIGDIDRVVAYDDAGGVIAARLVWMLRALGHDAALLDGGLRAWTGARSNTEPRRTPAQFTPRPWPAELIADMDDVAHAGNVLVDARDQDRYRGEREPLDPRAGHIPGARSVPCRENLDEEQRLLPLEVLRRRFIEAGAGDGSAVVSYCGSGITACHNLLVMEHAGLGRGRLYPGSWSQYSHAPHVRVATGPEA